MKPTIYLPGPVRNATHDEMWLWRRYITRLYADDAIFIDPLDDKTFGKWDYDDPTAMKRVQKECQKAIEDCTAIVAKMSQPSIGTAMGIFLGFWLGKHIVVIADEGKFPLLQYYCDKIVDDEDKAMKEILQRVPPSLAGPPGRSAPLEWSEIVALIRNACYVAGSDPALSGQLVRELASSLRRKDSSVDEIVEWNVIEELLTLQLQSYGLSTNEIDIIKVRAYYRSEQLGDMNRLLNSLEEDNARLRRRNRELLGENQRLRIEQAPVNEPRLPTPTTLEEAVEQIVDMYPERLELSLNSASELKDNPFEGLTAVADGLTFLATTYWESKSGRKECSDLCEECYRATTMRYVPWQAATTVGQYEEQYYTLWNRRRVPILEHLKKGNSKDRKHTIRIGFTYVEEEEIVVIGYIGRHQRTKRS